MLKKLSIAGLVLIASSGIAFADPNDSTPVADNSATSDTAASTGDAAATGSSDAAATSDSKATHKKHKKHKKHKRHHHHRQAAAQPAAAESDMSAAPVAYKGDYKGEVAAPCPTCPPGVMPGWYLGASLGSLLNYTTHGSNYNGLQGELFGGYSMMWDQWYGGLELFLNDNAELTSSRGSIKSSWGYGLSVLPGYMIQENVLGYLRLGIVDSHFTAGSSNNKFGGQVGLGLQTALCQNWDLRGEWIYSFYNSLSGTAHRGVPRSQQFNLGLLYKFGA